MDDSEAMVAWRDGRLPLVDAVMMASGDMILLSVEPTETDFGLGVRAVGTTNLASFLKLKPDWWSHIDPLVELQDPPRGVFFCGEGSHGSDGFIAHCDENRNLVFSIFLTCSNPFVKLSLAADRTVLHAVSSLGITWTVEVAAPWSIRTERGDDRR